MEIRVFRMSATSPVPPFSIEWDGPQTLVLAFFAPQFGLQPEPLERIRAVFPQSFLLGCSTGGEILGTSMEDCSISVTVLRFASTRLNLAYVDVSLDDVQSRKAGECLGSALASPDLKGVLIVAEGINMCRSELVRGLNVSLPAHTMVTGALASDGCNFKTTHVVVASPGEPMRLQSSQVGAVGLYGSSIRLACGSRGGWSPFGMERQVTRSEGNILYELDGKPALELYKKYLGDRARDLPAAALLYPLAVLDKTAQRSEVLVRSVMAINEETQSLTAAGDIREGAMVQLMYSNLDRLVEAAADAAESATTMREWSNHPILALVVSCVGRRMVLGERTEEELEAVFDALPSGALQAGLYAFGELSPSDGQCQLRNQTMTLTLIQED